MPSTYFVLDSHHVPCLHHHREVNAQFARCLREHGKGARPYERPEVGPPLPLIGADLVALRRLLPRATRGRPPTGKPRAAQARPLYARLRPEQREAFEAQAKARGFDDLGAYAVALMTADLEKA